MSAKCPSPAVWLILLITAQVNAQQTVLVDDFTRDDSLYHGHGWETINPGCWKIENHALRRRLRNRGDWGSKPEFPFRSLLDGTKPAIAKPPLPRPYAPALPIAMIWRRDWKLQGNYTIQIETTIRALLPVIEERKDDPDYVPAYSLMGIGFGSRSLLESWSVGRTKAKTAAWMALWRSDGRFGIYSHATDGPDPAERESEKESSSLRPGDKVNIELEVSGDDPEKATVTARFSAHSRTIAVQCLNVKRKEHTDGYFGVVGRGSLDFEVNRVRLVPLKNQPIQAPVNDLNVCYPLGDTLRKIDGFWQCTFIAMFRSDGKRAKIRVADSPEPQGGWKTEPVAGSAEIISNHFRLNTASIRVKLPHNPGEKTMYYTVWKDGSDVTADPRTGWLGKKDYIGRLPRLTAPYRLCGLGGHAITGPANMPETYKFGANWVRGQPTPDAYKHFEQYDFQILNWEDDVWYLELVFAPTSVDDAYKIINLTLGNPTTRWQMMRHWNTINPGDHDYGMNDLHGPEQYVVRKWNNLGQDPEYMRRNYQLVLHITSGGEDPSGTENPKHWRRWKMPNGDFTFLLLNARSWRDSLDTALWVNYGWGHNELVYERTDPMRVLLGEEQYAWLREVIRTDTSPLIAVTGLNGLHTVWQGSNSFDPETGLHFNQRGRGAGDYAGWVKAGTDRVLDLLGSRQGIITVYGDVHTASIMKNLRHRVYESSFGPIGRSGSRGVKKGFGRQMSDYDRRPLEMFALYHTKYDSPDLTPIQGPKHWNFLEMHCDPRGEDPRFSLKIRNIVDPPVAEDRASGTGRPHTCMLPPIRTLPEADVLFSTVDGRPIRGTRSLADGSVPLRGLVEIYGKDVKPGTRVRMTAFNGKNLDARMIETKPVDGVKLRAFRANIERLERQAEAEYQGWIRDYQKSKGAN
ncbi:MAG: hypothetical protein ACYTAO_10220 [Planctomycetota bacterium]